MIRFTVTLDEAPVNRPFGTPMRYRPTRKDGRTILFLITYDTPKLMVITLLQLLILFVYFFSFYLSSPL